ncbi:hypothetical protein SJ652_14240, partial [Enterococcus faecium]
ANKRNKIDCYNKVFETFLKNYELFRDYCISKEKADFDRFFHYLSVVLAFIAGAIVLVFCHHLFGAHSILIVSILFLIMALTQTFHLWQFYHTNRFTI